MAYGAPELLFHKYDLGRVIERHREESAAAPLTIPEDRLLNTPTDDLVAPIVEQWRLRVPDLRLDDMEVDQREGPITVYDHFRRWDDDEGRMTVHGTIVELSVPFDGDKDFFFIRPSTRNLSPPRAHVERDHLLLRTEGRDLNAGAVKKGFDTTIADIEQYLGWQRNDVHSTLR